MSLIKKIGKIFKRERKKPTRENVSSDHQRTGVTIDKKGKEEVDIDKVKQMY